MTSFAFQGLAIGGPANGRVLVSHTMTYNALYLVQCDATNRQAQPLIRSQRVLGKFRYNAHSYGKHQFFLPAGQTLFYFLRRWNPPACQDDWPAFLRQVAENLRAK